MSSFILKYRILSCLILILILSIPTYYNLFQSGFFTMHDNVSVLRLLEMNKCFEDLQIPCRWVPDMGAGYGHPLFNYHPPLAYYIGEILTIFFSYIETVKLLFLIALLSSGIFMYFLVRELFGDLAGVLGAVSFIYAPYHSVDLYVRGDVAELLGIATFPLILWSIYKFLSEGKIKWFVLSVVSCDALVLSHNIMSMLFGPIILVWSIYWLVRFNFKKVWSLILIFVWALGIAAFFVFPSIFELKYINVLQAQGYYDFHNHFVTVEQLFFDRNFNYGGSGFGSIDHLSFQIGWPYWILALGITVISVIFFLKRRKWEFGILILVGIAFLCSVFMTHSRSVFIWETLSPFLSFVQFPWRFLGIAIFASSFLIGGSIIFFKKKWRVIYAAVLLVMVIGLNLNYFKPKEFWPNATDQSLLTGDSFAQQSMSTLLDYVPVQNKTRPKVLAPNRPVIEEGSAKVSEINKWSNGFSFNLSVSSEKSKILIPVFYFPDWEVFLNNSKVKILIDNNLGAMEILAPKGSYQVIGKFENTTLRRVVDLVSLFSILALLGLAILQVRKSAIIKFNHK